MHIIVCPVVKVEKMGQNGSTSEPVRDEVRDEVFEEEISDQVVNSHGNSRQPPAGRLAAVKNT